MRNVTFSRAVLYPDNSGIETGVEFDPTYRIGGDDTAYFQLQGVGDAVSVRVDHIPIIIDWLGSIEIEDERHRYAMRKMEKVAK